MTSDPASYTALDAAGSPAFSTDRQTLFHLRGSPPQLWSLDLATGMSQALTRHEDAVAAFRRAPGDDRIIYGVDAGGDERQQVWLWDGAPRALTHAPGVIHRLGGWSPDGTRVAITANDRDEAHFDVLFLDPATGVQTRLHHGTHEASLGGWHPSGTRLAAMTERSTYDVRPFVLDAATGQADSLPRTGPARYAALRWDGDTLMGLTDAGSRDHMALCRLDGDGAPTPVHAPDRDVEAWAFAPGTRLLATIENNGGYALLRVGPIDGERPIVDGLPRGVVADPAWSPDGRRLAVSASSPTEPPGLWVWESGQVRPVWRPDCLLPTVPFRLVEWDSDGRRIPGWLALPPGPAPSAGHPAVVWVHGGPAWQTRANFRPDMQALLAKGCAVLMPNVRGSSSYGRASMASADRERRLDAVADFAAAAHWLRAQPGIDPARIAVMGQSYGGYMVLAAITEHPELWRAAVDFYSISDFGTLLDGTGPWRRNHRAEEYGDPVRHRALFDSISPLRHVNRIAVPLLVLHGKRDPRVPFSESGQLVAALQARGKPVQFEAFGDAGHGFVRPDDRRRAFAAVADFLERTL